MNTINQNSLLSAMKTMQAVAEGKGQAVSTDAQQNNDFQSLMSKLIDSVNDAEMTSSRLKKAYELGDKDVNLTQVMIASQKSEISFQALLQVRNKLLSAYQEIMRIQI